MKQNKKLSLKEEVEKEAKKIEEEIADYPGLEDIKVSEKMEAALLADIRAYEKKCAKEKETRNTTEKRAEEFSEELAPNFTGCTNDNHVAGLSEEDMEALRIGRELMKKKNNSDEKELFKVNTDYHKHLNSDDGGKEGGKNKGEKTKVFRMPRKKRVVFALVAVFVLVLATGATSLGSKSYWKVLWERIVGEEKVAIINVADMDKKDTEDVEKIDVFKEIKETFGIDFIRFGYLPEGMKLEKYKIDKTQQNIQLFYKYNDEVIRFTIYINMADSSLGQKEEDKQIDEFEVDTAKQKIVVKTYEVVTYNNERFIANFEYDGINYQLKGIMDRTELENILKNLIYFK